MPRFVILRHDTPAHAERACHWDLMFETEGLLVTWALDAPPVAGQVVAATRLADHRIGYLDYEGEISRGRGTVTRWDAGVYQMLSQSQSVWHVAVSGNHLVGRLTLKTLSDSAGHWSVVYEPEFVVRH